MRKSWEAYQRASLADQRASLADQRASLADQRSFYDIRCYLYFL